VRVHVAQITAYTLEQAMEVAPEHCPYILALLEMTDALAVPHKLTGADISLFLLAYELM